MQLLTAVSPQSLYTPSWKIESNYSTRVLTGNWVEERRKVRTDRRWRVLRGRTGREGQEWSHSYFQTQDPR